jgi:hypothetical protein
MLYYNIIMIFLKQQENLFKKKYSKVHKKVIIYMLN